MIGKALTVLLVVGAVAAGAPGAVREVMDSDVDRAMGAATRYLYAQQQTDGMWPYQWRRGQMPQGGTTSIALFALLEAGESIDDPRMKKGIEAIVKLKRQNLYFVAVRTMVLSLAVGGNKNSPLLKPLREDVAWLTRKVRAAGAWGYTGPERNGDNSCSQFALLALWEADRAGVEMSSSMVRSVQSAWLRRQQRDGGWKYAGLKSAKAPSTMTMTTAGLASLYICQDILVSSCRPYSFQSKIDKGWNLLEKKLTEDYADNGYLAFCVQRVGMASGRKFMGKMDWFAVGASKLVAPSPRGRTYRGEWGSITRASFELIFLARAKIPLTFNKLQYGDQGQWNFHTRDLAGFAEYMRRNFEQRMRWQIVNIDGKADSLRDAPVLLVPGNKALSFTPKQWDKLREYTLRGGLMVFVPIHGNALVVKSAKKALASLYDEQRKMAGAHYELRLLPSDHPLYNVNKKIRNGARAMPIWGVSDGTRLLAAVLTKDPTCAWQRRSTARGKRDFDIGANLLFYAVGGNNMLMRLRPVFRPIKGEARQRVKLAWLKHGGNWHTQPYALEYLSTKLRVENRVAIDIKVGAEATPAALEGQHLVWITGSEPLKFTTAQIAALGGYLDAGGVIFFNAIGGSIAFNRSVGQAIRAITAKRGIVGGEVSSTSPLMTGKCGDFRGPRIEKLKRTVLLRRVHSRAPAPLNVYVRGKRIAIIHGPFGIHDTIDGHTAHGAMSFLPNSARDLAANVVLYALAEGLKPLPQPKSKPASPVTATDSPRINANTRK